MAKLVTNPSPTPTPNPNQAAAPVPAVAAKRPKLQRGYALEDADARLGLKNGYGESAG